MSTALDSLLNLQQQNPDPLYEQLRQRILGFMQEKDQLKSRILELENQLSESLHGQEEYRQLLVKVTQDMADWKSWLATQPKVG